MKKKLPKVVKTIAVMLICVLQFNKSTAQWSTSSYLNDPICSDNGTQQNSVIAPDGSGGAIIAWVDMRTGMDIYAQRIDANGVAKWAANGIEISTAAYFRAQPAIISDGNGGAIITWADYRNGLDFDIYAQRVNSDGTMQWTPNGVNIINAQGDQSNPVLTTDGNGGAIFTWTDNRNLSQIINHIYTQGINANGTLKWSDVAICAAPEGQVNPEIISDSNGGAIIAWQDGRNQSDGTSAADIYAQRVGSNGIPQWIADGIEICRAYRMQTYPVLTSDGTGGAIITWLDERNVTNLLPYNADIYAQRVNASGLIQWVSNGVGICTDNNNQLFEKITSDEFGGAIITWVTWIGTGTGNLASSKIYFQRINSNGTSLWMNNGIPIGAADVKNPVINSDGYGGAFLTWEASISSGHEIYSQHLDTNGLELWQPFGGVVVSNAYGTQEGPHTITDNNGGIIIAWDDYRNVNLDIYAQHVLADGKLGGSTPTLNPAIASLPNVSVYPNPVITDLIIDVSSIISKTPIIITLLDISGRILETTQGNGIITLSLKNYASSVYILQISYEGKNMMKQIIKK